MNAHVPAELRVEQVPLTRLRARFDARTINDQTVAGLVDSIAAVGIMNPLRVRQVSDDADALEVIAGHHRLQAARKAGLDTVPCVIVSDDDTRAELAMIDENLIRAELGAAERAQATSQRRKLWLILHPETAEHVAGGHARYRTTGEAAADNLAAAPAVPSYADAQAKATGRSVRDVRRDAERGDKICPNAIAMIAGTPLNKGIYLEGLKNLTPKKQIQKIRYDLENPPERRKSKANVAPPGDQAPAPDLPITEIAIESMKPEPEKPAERPLDKTKIGTTVYSISERIREAELVGEVLALASLIGDVHVGRALVAHLRDEPLKDLKPLPDPNVYEKTIAAAASMVADLGTNAHLLSQALRSGLGEEIGKRTELLLNQESAE